MTNTRSLIAMISGSSDEIIKNREKTSGEYYVIPVYKKYIQRGWRVETSIASMMYDMGTPDASDDIYHHAFRVGFNSPNATGTTNSFDLKRWFNNAKSGGIGQIRD